LLLLLAVAEVVYSLTCFTRDATEIMQKLDRSDVTNGTMPSTPPAQEECSAESYWCTVNVKFLNGKVTYTQGCEDDLDDMAWYGCFLRD
ncbi:hypothetical protein PFISCL1PPCAC_21106, partial [Pristionchus fissidentatus]